MPPLLSVIVLNYNHKQFLPGMFDSLLRQRNVDLEVVLVDDCSDEPCNDVVDAYVSRGLAIRLLTHTERLYIKNARIVGMRAATGTIIAFADADDTLQGEESLAENVRIFCEADADILHFRSVFTDPEGNFLRYYTLADPFADRLSGNDIFSRWLKTDIRGTILCNKLYSRELCLSICEMAAASKVTRYVEEVYLTSLLLLHAHRYVGSHCVGYGYNWAERGWQQAAGRAVYMYLIRSELLPYLENNGFPASHVRDFAPFLDHDIALNMGHALRSASDEPTTANWLRENMDPDALLRTMMLGGRINADKIVAAFRSLRSGPPQ